MKLAAAAVLTLAFVLCVTDEQTHKKSGRMIALLTGAYAAMVLAVIV